VKKRKSSGVKIRNAIRRKEEDNKGKRDEKERNYTRKRKEDRSKSRRRSNKTGIKAVA